MNEKKKLNIEYRGTRLYVNGVLAKSINQSKARCRDIHFVEKLGSVGKSPSGFVIKLDDRDSMAQGNQELKRWRKIKRKDKKYFVPIIAFGKAKGLKGQRYYTWIIQRYIHFQRGRISYDITKKAMEIGRRYKIKDVLHMSTANYGVDLNGELKIYDWGW